MEIEPPETIIKLIFSRIPTSTLIQVISFLDLNTLAALKTAFTNTPFDDPFLQLVKGYYFVLTYLNKTDRSMYYGFYDEPYFKNLEYSQVASLTEEYFKRF